MKLTLIAAILPLLAVALADAPGENAALVKPLIIGEDSGGNPYAIQTLRAISGTFLNPPLAADPNAVKPPSGLHNDCPDDTLASKLGETSAEQGKKKAAALIETKANNKIMRLKQKILEAGPGDDEDKEEIKGCQKQIIDIEDEAIDDPEELKKLEKMDEVKQIQEKMSQMDIIVST